MVVICPLGMQQASIYSLHFQPLQSQDYGSSLFPLVYHRKSHIPIAGTQDISRDAVNTYQRHACCLHLSSFDLQNRFKAHP